MAYIMDDMTVREMKEAMQTVKTVIIPVGCVEQHGYHLPLSTDFHNANEIPRRAGDRLRAVVAPTIPYCFSGGELPGTINVSLQAFSMYVSDICTEFIRHGFENIIIMPGHGGTDNTAALKSCLQMLMRRNPCYRKITFSLLEIFRLSPTWLKIFSEGPEYDFHAGNVETSLMMYWKPDLVRPEIVMDEPYVAKMMRTDQDWYEVTEKIVDHEFIIPDVHQREEIKIGVMGFPEKATAETGKIICDEIVEGLISYVNMLEDR